MPITSAALVLVASSLNAAEPATGWRGNGTGLWPDAQPVLEWGRNPHGALEDLRASADRPKVNEPGAATKIEKGLIRDWLVVGPFTVADSVKDFDRDFLNGEKNAQPTAGDKVGEHEWKPATVPPDDIMVFGTALLPWLDLAKAIGYQKNQLAYAHTYLRSPRGGKAIIVVEHGQGLKAWLNGKEVYRSPERAIVLGTYPNLSRIELSYLDARSSRFEIDLKPGWNRLLVKLSTANKDGYTDMQFSMRIMDPPDVKYETKNIRWMTPLPARSTSTPILVGDRIFVMAEPDELLCIDKNDGKILWSAAINYYEALSPEEKRAKPAFAEQVDPLVEKLKKETDRSRRLQLRTDIKKALIGIDAERFRVAANDHFEAHFGVVGFTMPTPVSDGKFVYVWIGTGVAACFDLDGKRQWINRIKTDHLAYGSSPALAGGVLAVFLNEAYGLDAKTGKLLWKQAKLRNNIASLMAATFNGKQVFITQRGDAINPADGEFLYRPRESLAAGDTGWSPGVILGSRLYQIRHGVTNITVLDFADVQGDAWEPKVIKHLQLPETISRQPDGKWLDRSTAGSPLVHDGIIYQVDIYQELFALDEKTGKMLYRQKLPMQGLMHYNAVPVAASVTLIGKHLFACDNQGTTVVFEPGPQYKEVAVNRIATQLERFLPIPAQETLTYSPPIADGRRIYLRGEGYLYCIGAE
jgi:outer membrane protein assembly factor BamB